MVFAWKPYRIHLGSFSQYLAGSVPLADGIVASEDSFTVVERDGFSGADTALVQGYYDALTEIDEAAKWAAEE